MFNNTNFEIFVHKIYETSPEYIKFILQFNLINFSLLAKNDDGNTLLHLIIIKHDSKIANETLDLYIKHISNSKFYTNEEKLNFLNAQNKLGDTPLHLAVKNNKLDLAKKLHEQGASIGIANNDNFMVNITDSDEPEKKEPQINNFNDFLKNIMAPFNNKQTNNDKKSVDKHTVLSETSNLSDTLQNKNDNEQFLVFINDRKNKDNKDNKDNIQLVHKGGDNISSLNFYDQNGGFNNETELVSLNLYNENSEMISNINIEQDGGRKRHKNHNKRSIVKKNESSQVHDDTIAKIQDLGYNLDDAKYLKAALYQYIKETYPDLSNLARAKKMFDSVTKETIGKIDIKAIKKIIQQKAQQKEINNGEKEKEKEEKSDKKNKKDKSEKKDKKEKSVKKDKKEKSVKKDKSDNKDKKDKSDKKE
jgi:hypothetical protein